MLIPALHFFGTCSQAIALYKQVFGAEVIHISYYRDAPSGSAMVTEENLDQVMHAELVIAGVRVNVCDVVEQVTSGNRHLFNVFLDSAEEVTVAYHKLAKGGKIFTELGPQFWAPMYGDIEDCFGVRWQLLVDQQ